MTEKHSHFLGDTYPLEQRQQGWQPVSQFTWNDDLFDNNSDTDEGSRSGKGFTAPTVADNMKLPEQEQRQLAQIQLAFSFRLMDTTTLIGAAEELLATISTLLMRAILLPSVATQTQDMHACIRFRSRIFLCSNG
jgi:hypothetical protein